MEDYQAMMINIVIEINEQKQPIKMTCKGEYSSWLNYIILANDSSGCICVSCDQNGLGKTAKTTIFEIKWTCSKSVWTRWIPRQVCVAMFMKLCDIVYLCYHSDMLLSDYEYVHQCLKFGTDVHVAMVMLADANKTFFYEVRIEFIRWYNFYYCIWYCIRIY